MGSINKSIIALVIVGLVVSQLVGVESCRRNAEAARARMRQLLKDYPELASELSNSNTNSNSNSNNANNGSNGSNGSNGQTNNANSNTANTNGNTANTST